MMRPMVEDISTKVRTYTVEDISDNDIATYSQNFGSHYICTSHNCRTKLNNLDSLKQHIVRHLNDVVIDRMIRVVRTDYTGGFKNHICTHCQYSSLNSSNVRTHVMLHLNIKQHACQHCSYKSNQKSHLLSHMRRRHGVQ